jgi:hypothetical protein
MESVKIVVRFADGRILKGYSQDFFPNKPVFHLVRNLARGSANHKEICMSDLKAIFFVDGEILQGSALGYNPKDPGFFLFPSDPKSNNHRVFVVNSAVKNFRYLEDELAQKTRRDDYQCLIPETRGKLLMVTDEERMLLRLVLSKVMETDGGREYIVEKLGIAYLQIAEELLKEMESN